MTQSFVHDFGGSPAPIEYREVTMAKLLLLTCGVLVLSGFGLGIAIGWWILIGRAERQTRQIKRKFASLGRIKGKTLAEIEAVLGSPSSWSSLGNNRFCYSWSTKKYHTTLIFKG